MQLALTLETSWTQLKKDSCDVVVEMTAPMYHPWGSGPRPVALGLKRWRSNRLPRYPKGADSSSVPGELGL